MPPAKSTSVTSGGDRQGVKTPRKQTSTPVVVTVQPSCHPTSKKMKLEKQDSIHESSKMLAKKPAEISLEVPTSNTRRYSLPTAQLIEEAKENAYLKKNQLGKPTDSSRRGSRVDLNSSRRSSRGEVNGVTSSLLVPSSNARRLSSPSIAVSANSSRRGSFIATLGLGETANASSSRRGSSVGIAIASGSTGLLGGLSAFGSSAPPPAPTTKKNETLLGFLPTSGKTGNGNRKGAKDSTGRFSSWLSGDKAQSSSQTAGVLGASLTYRARLQAFAICLLAGVLMEILGCSGMLMKFNKKTVLLFLVFVIIGNAAIITSTTFLASFAIQRRQLTEESRIVSGVLYVILLVLSVASALVLHKPNLVLLAILFKDLAAIWYSLTFIPMARAAIRQCLAA